ncbi:transglycosylase domain-containing protein [Gracilibacillus sp. YIM 98692]|uniref:transglycosylase domain-containing protein n=1 Tax=Gracilibacillus sp. YIM 98692 TaxID=2663532 RepID=UPI0013D2844A|nr:transglycosylase domain-containing protein [Gracilibacillus sp. YIM 98692]
MEIKDFLLKSWNNIKNIWQKQTIQTSTRIGYHIIWNIVLFFITIAIVGAFFLGGLGAGYFASLVDDESVQSEEEMASAIYSYEETSEMYFANDQFLAEISTDLLRDEIGLTQVGENVRNAVIATEDEYFETHNGIVPKAIFRAVFQEVTNAANKTGGSTLTQQLIKNQILTNEVSFERKAKEMLLALRLERYFDKDEILEAYLNIVPFGRNSSGQNIAGIQTAAEGIFGLKANELNIAQAAFIAGLPQSPSYYTPFNNGGGLKSEEGLQPGLNRMKSVLARMHEESYITDNEYQEALDYDIVSDFKPREPSVLEEYPFLMNELKDRATDILVNVLAEQDGYTEEDLNNSDILEEEYHILANRALESNGYRIHSTIDKEVYDAFQKIAKEYSNYGRDKVARNERTGEVIRVENPETGELEPLVVPVQAGSVLLENSTGKIISFVAGRDYNTSQQNHATSVPRHNGSTMKPLAVYAPAMELGQVQPGSVIADVEEDFSSYGYNRPPTNYTGRYYGLVSAREALYKSHNVSALQVYKDILGQNPAQQFLDKMGFDHLSDDPAHNDYANLSLALGSSYRGVTVEENTNAYATFGNGGDFVNGYMIEKIETNDGEVIYEHQSETTEDVFSPQTNYLMIDMMRDVLTRGTGTAARANLNNKSVDWAGKTGTSNDFRDTWFVATNPNVTLGSWMGYDYNQQLDSGYSARNNVFWAQLVNAATEIRPELMAPSQSFERPGGIVSRTYCTTSGMLPSDLCSELGLVQTDIYNANYVPTKRDDSLVEETYVMVGDKAVIAGTDTPKEFTEGDGVAFNPDWLEDMGYDKLSDIEQLIPSDSGVWGDIQFPETDEINNDGEDPLMPTSVSLNEQNLSWDASSSQDVVGYRIYRSSHPDDDNFQRIGSTTDLSYTLPSREAVYHVRAVDYFGQESKASTEVIMGDFSEPEEPEKEQENQEDDQQEEQADENENNNSNNSEDSSSEDNSEENTNSDQDQNSNSNDDNTETQSNDEENTENE